MTPLLCLQLPNQSPIIDLKRGIFEHFCQIPPTFSVLIFQTYAFLVAIYLIDTSIIFEKIFYVTCVYAKYFVILQPNWVKVYNTAPHYTILYDTILTNKLYDYDN